jgi:endonuclease YncB( thermonuclease family)
MNRRRFVYGAMALALTSQARAAERRAVSGDSFVDGATEVRLADIIAPDILEPYGSDATLALNGLIASALLTIEDVAPLDRWERRVARVSLLEDGRTLQEALAAAGAARVRPEAGDAEFIARLFAIENEARTAKRGLWADWGYRVHDAANANSATGAFSLVEGTVAQSVLRGGRAYLNFGEDYRTDFTVTAPSRLARKWAKEGVDLLSLTGARVRVRGYVAWINGPSIELSHKQQVEVLA